MKTMTSALAIYHDGDVDTNRSGNPHLNDLIEQRYSRRQTLMGGLSAASAAVFGGILPAVTMASSRRGPSIARAVSGFTSRTIS